MGFKQGVIGAVVSANALPQDAVGSGRAGVELIDLGGFVPGNALCGEFAADPFGFFCQEDGASQTQRKQGWRHAAHASADD